MTLECDVTFGVAILDLKSFGALNRLGLANVIRTEHKVKAEIVPLLIGALGSVSKQRKTYIDIICIPNIICSTQISTITSADRILRDVLSL